MPAPQCLTRSEGVTREAGRVVQITSHESRCIASAPWIALVTALLFVAHPIQTQAVTYIVQRFASLVALWYLLAIVCYLQWRLAPPVARFRALWYTAALAATILAMKTKENSFTLPLMILLVEGIFFWPITRRQWRVLLPFVLTFLIIPLSQAGAIGEAEGFARDATTMSRSTYLCTQFRVIVTYLRLLLLPLDQSLDYDYPIYASVVHPAVFWSLLLLLALFGSALCALVRSRASTHAAQLRLIAFGILWFFLALAIESSIIPIKDVIFEHRVYLPSVGFFLAASLSAHWVTERWRRMRTPIIVSVVLMIGGFSVATYQRNRVWRDHLTLWQDVVAQAPHNPRGHYNLGLAYEDAGRLEEAIQAYRQTMALKSDYTDAYNNLANVYKAQGRLDEAIPIYQQAMTIDPRHAEAHNNLGNIYTVQGRLEEAVRLYQRALELKPGYAEACNNLGIALTTQGRLDEAIEVYRRGLSLQEDLDKIHYNLGNTYMKQGMTVPALQEYQAAIALKPELPEYHFALGNAYAETEQSRDAIRVYKHLSSVRPDLAEGHFALGNAYADQGQMTEALQAYATAVRLKPDFAEAHNNLGNIHTLEGRFEEAIRAYRQALEIKPDYAEAVRNLARATEQLGRTRSPGR